MKIVNSLLTQDERAWLDLALACKKAREASLYDLVDDINEKYSSYHSIVINKESNLPQSVFSARDFEKLKQHFIDLYNKPPSKLKNLLIFKRREHTLTSCPYCGNPTIPDTLDHFIPKDLLAEYSIFPNNLVPQCRACAPIKSNKYYSSEHNLVMFAHPFYSSLLDDIYIEVIPSLQDGQVVFQVKFSTHTESEVDILAITLHIKSLKIKERIMMYCDKEIKKWIRKLKKNHFDIEVVLNARYSEHNQHEMRSNWEFVLYKALLENEAVMSFLKSIKPEEKVIINENRELLVLDI